MISNLSMIKALVVVAHPDDETIWMGGKILHEKDWDWTVVSLCRKDDADRKPKFFKVCEELNARAFISDLDDENVERWLPNIDEIVKRIEPITHDKCFDYVFTHGKNGEYGHKRHIEVNRAVKIMFEQGLINCKSIFEFAYTSVGEPFSCVPNKKSEEIFSLSIEEVEKKKYLINKVYGFDKKSFEFISCSDKETFNRVF